MRLLYSSIPVRILILLISLSTSCRFVPFTAASATEGSKNCERLQETLTYTQEEAPRDLSSIVSLLFVSDSIPCLNRSQHHLCPIIPYLLYQHLERLFLCNSVHSPNLASGSCWKNKPSAWRCRWCWSRMVRRWTSWPSWRAYYWNHCHKIDR